MRHRACLENDWAEVAPCFQRLQLLSAWHREFLRELGFLRLLVVLKHTLGRDGRRCKDASQLSTQEVSLLARERRVAVNVGVQVSS